MLCYASGPAGGVNRQWPGISPCPRQIPHSGYLSVSLYIITNWWNPKSVLGAVCYPEISNSPFVVLNFNQTPDDPDNPFLFLLLLYSLVVSITAPLWGDTDSSWVDSGAPKTRYRAKILS